MIEIKEKIRNILFKYIITKKIYEKMSYIKGKIYYGYTLKRNIEKFKKENSNGVLLIFTPEHANLGDHAIAYSEQLILDEIGINYLEITGLQLQILKNYNFLNCLDDYTVFINGGGNLGMLWPDIEEMNRKIISSNLNSTIFIFPNTIYYENDSNGKQEFEKSKRIYNAHSKLYIYAREKNSYMKMKNNYNHVKLMPDMVLFLNELEKSSNKKGCLLCLRNDVEKTLTNANYIYIKNELNKIFNNNVEEIDTVLDYNVSVNNRTDELKSFFKTLKQRELVITDRLHGMIFCAITGTNCIVLNSKSPKLKGCYEWIKKLEYIKFCDNLNDIESIWNDLKEVNHNYHVSFESYKQELKKDLKERKFL